MAISLNDVTKSSELGSKKNPTKKSASSTAKKAISKPAAASKAKQQKTRPWQAPQQGEGEELIPQLQSSLPKAPAQALEAAAAALSDSALDLSGSEDGLSGFEYANTAPRTPDERRQRRKELQDELVQEWLAVAEDLKSQGLDRLPAPLAEKLKKSWIGQIQLYPKLRVPLPGFLVTRYRYKGK